MASTPDLDPEDVRVIAGRAGGLDARTVWGYLDGARTQRRKRRGIEKALRELGMGALVRPERPGIARA